MYVGESASGRNDRIEGPRLAQLVSALYLDGKLSGESQVVNPSYMYIYNHISLRVKKYETLRFIYIHTRPLLLSKREEEKLDNTQHATHST